VAKGCEYQLETHLAERTCEAGQGKGDRAKPKSSRVFLPREEGDFGDSPSGALGTAEMSELETVRLIVCSFSCCWY